MPTEQLNNPWHADVATAAAENLWRRRMYEILELARPNDRASRYCDIFIITLIFCNMIAIILESVSALQQQYEPLFYWFEVMSVSVFSVEYFLRAWSCVEAPDLDSHRAVVSRLRFLLRPMSLIDLLVVLPYFLSLFLSVDLRFLRSLRLLRLFKLTRYSASMTLLQKVLHDEAQSFGAAFFILAVVLVFAACGIYLFEHDAQPADFGSIPQSLWWAVATLTTVGYGDVTPVTFGGKIFGMVIMIIGIGMVALPAGILASAFSEQMRLRRMEFEELAHSVLDDGRVTVEEQQQMMQARIALGLNEEDAEKIFARIAREEFQRKGLCPHCHKPLYNRRKTDSGLSDSV